MRTTRLISLIACFFLFSAMSRAGCVKGHRSNKASGVNSAILPANVTPRFAQVVRDCRESTVEIRLPIDQLDPRSLIRPKNVDCDSENERTHR